MIKKPDNTITKTQLIKQYNNISIALQGLYTDCHNTADRLITLEQELADIKKLLVDILKYHKSLSELETKLFRDNLSK